MQLNSKYGCYFLLFCGFLRKEGASLVNGGKRQENHRQTAEDSLSSNAMGYMYQKCAQRSIFCVIEVVFLI